MRLLPLPPPAGTADRTVRRLAFSADGRFLTAVVGRPDNPRRRLVRYDLARDLPGPMPTAANKADRPTGDPAAGPDGRTSAELISPMSLVVLTADDRLTLGARPGEYFTGLGFSADGDTLYVGVDAVDPFDDATALRFARLDVPHWREVGHPDRIDEAVPTDDVAPAVCFADAGGGVLAVGTSAGTAVLFDLIAAVPLLTVEHGLGDADPPPVQEVLLRPDGQHLVTRSDRGVVVWDAVTGGWLARPDAARPLTGVAFAPDGSALWASSLDGTAYRFAAPRYAAAGKLALGLGPLHSVAVAPDGLTAAAGTAAGTVAVWDV
jgi:hypothetical protein